MIRVEYMQLGGYILFTAEQGLAEEELSENASYGPGS